MGWWWMCHCGLRTRLLIWLLLGEKCMHRTHTVCTDSGVCVCVRTSALWTMRCNSQPTELIPAPPSTTTRTSHTNNTNRNCTCNYARFSTSTTHIPPIFIFKKNNFVSTCAGALWRFDVVAVVVVVVVVAPLTMWCIFIACNPHLSERIRKSSRGWCIFYWCGRFWASERVSGDAATWKKQRRVVSKQLTCPFRLHFFRFVSFQFEMSCFAAFFLYYCVCDWQLPVAISIMPRHKCMRRVKLQSPGKAIIY